MKWLIAFLLIVSSGIALASNLTGPEGGWTNKTLTGPNSRGSVTPPPTNFILANTGSVLLVNTGSKFLIQ